MINLKNINNNIISNRWKARYAELPNEIKDKLDKLDRDDIKQYQLQVIKRQRLYPQIGDIFKINPKDNIVLYGIVINNHINNINGEDLLVILIYKKEIDIKKAICRGVKQEDLLLPPQIVGKEYWTRGYFYNFDHSEIIAHINNYGFYKILTRKFVDEYGKEVAEEPQLVEIFGVSTITGIAHKINQELIIAGML